MTDAGRYPAVPEGRLDGWTRTEAFSETVFELSAVSVVGHTVVYEDDRLRATVRDATGGDYDRMWRFFFATRLDFSPPLPPGVGPAAVFSTVASNADDQFVATLRDRGFRDVSQGRRERMRVDSGDRARLRRYDASLALDDGAVTLPVGGLLAVWTVDGEFRLAGGAYPSRPLADVLSGAANGDLDADPGGLRDDLLDVIRAIR